MASSLLRDEETWVNPLTGGHEAGKQDSNFYMQSLRSPMLPLNYAPHTMSTT